MNQGQTLFAQVMAHAPHREFQRCVRRYRGDARVRRFTCWDHFLVLAFAQLTYPRESARHRGLLGCDAGSALSHGVSKHPLPEHAGGCQRETQLAGLCRFRPGAESTRPAGSMRTRASAPISIRPFMPWTPPRSISVSRSSPGRTFGAPRARSSCTRSWTSGAASLPSCRSPTAAFTTSTSWTNSSPSRAQCT
ncbi:hypothetical protein BH23GEM5_BH23GEM5_23170 [soil metagenome]